MNTYSERGSQGETPIERRARCEVQVSKRVLFFSLANEWHNEWYTLFYASAECVPKASAGETHEEEGKLHLGYTDITKPPKHLSRNNDTRVLLSNSLLENIIVERGNV